jgi:cell division transport system permease protein
MLAFLRIIKYSFQDIGRNIGLSFMTVFILVLMLLSVNVLWAVDVLTGEAIGAVKEQINASLYFVPDASAEDISEIQTYVNSFPEVLDIKLESREEVLENFKNRHANSSEILDALNELGDNPFGATMILKTREPEDYKKIIMALDVPEYAYLIESKSFEGQEGAIEKLQNITNRIEQVGLGLSFLFAIISFLIIFNTIRVSIQSQRQEIGIKRLVGASNWFIRGPYLIVAFIFTVMSLALTISIVFFSLRYLDPYLSVVFPSGFSLTNYYKSNILMLFGSQTIAVLLLTFFSSLLAMRKQLKV